MAQPELKALRSLIQEGHARKLLRAAMILADDLLTTKPAATFRPRRIERQNGSLRRWCKRLTRLTYAFSEEWDKLDAAYGSAFWTLDPAE